MALWGFGRVCHPCKIQEPWERGQWDTLSQIPHFENLDFTTMAFTLSERSCSWRVLSRGLTKETELFKAPSAVSRSPNTIALYFPLLVLPILAGNLIHALPTGLTSSPSPFYKLCPSVSASRPLHSQAGCSTCWPKLCPSCLLHRSQQSQTWLSSLTTTKY